MDTVEAALQKKVVRDQLQLIKLRNESPAFRGRLEIRDVPPHLLHLTWRNQNCSATLEANLRDASFRITHVRGGESTLLMFP